MNEEVFGSASYERPTKTQTELQLAAFREQVLVPLGQKAKEPLPWLGSNLVGWGLVVPSFLFLIFQFWGFVITGGLFFLWGHLSNEPRRLHYKISEARKFLKIYTNLEQRALEQNEKMRAYGIEDLDGCGYHEQNQRDYKTNKRSIKATLKRNAAKIAQHERKNIN